MSESASEATSRPRPGARLPHPRLGRLVEHYHGYDFALPAPGVHHGLPSAELTVVLQFGQPLDVGWLGEPDSRGAHVAIASGMHTAAAEIHLEGRQCGIQLGLTAAGARAILQMPMSALATEIVPLDAVLPPQLQTLHEQLAALPTWPARYSLLDDTLVALVAARDTPQLAAPRSELTWAWQQIVAAGGQERVAALADELGWSRRHLTGQFRAEFGLSPKQFARVARFQRSRDLVARGTPLSDVAYGCGFADQAHLTREWRCMSGYTPLEWRRAEFPIVQDLDELTPQSG